jgi:hypothetical protein
MVLGERGLPGIEVAFVVAFSIGINMLLYAGIGWIVGFLYSQIYRRTRAPAPSD